jgi:hypothetical protein
MWVESLDQYLVNPAVGLTSTDSFPQKRSTTAKQTYDAIVRRDWGFVRRQAQPEMVFISTAPGTDMSSSNGYYIYDQSAGEGQTLYLIDFGVSLAHSVCMDICSMIVLLNGSTGIH